MIVALFKALHQLTDPRLRAVVAFGVFAAMLTYVVLIGLAWWGLAHSHWFGAHWIDASSRVVVGLLALVLPLPFFPAVATTVMSARLEAVAEAVEDRHYRGQEWPRPQRWTEILATTLRFLGVTVVVNLLALPLYALLMFTGLAVVLAAVVNGYLLGREYYELVALRHLAPESSRLLFRNSLGRIWLAGIVIALLFAVPVVNLVAPVVATAFMLHVVQTLQVRATRV
jgi:CysZ protein